MSQQNTIQYKAQLQIFSYSWHYNTYTEGLRKLCIYHPILNVLDKSIQGPGSDPIYGKYNVESGGNWEDKVRVQQLVLTAEAT